VRSPGILLSLKALTFALVLVAASLAGCANTSTPTKTTTTSSTTTTMTTTSSTPPVTGTAKSDDFESATVGGKPAGWDVEAGNWSVVTNASAPSGSKVLYSDKTDLGETSIIFEEAGEWSDFEASVNIDLLGGTKAQAGGIIFRHHDSKNYYVVRYNENEKMWNLFRTIDGAREKFSSTEASSAFAGGLNNWFDLRLEARGAHITVMTGAITVIDYTEDNAAAPKAGEVGLWTRYDSMTQFDGFTLAAN
jgi:hypothetical protein